MSNFLGDLGNAIKNGFPTAAKAFNDWLTEKRPDNTKRPRAASSDPTSAIDAPEKLEIINFPHDRPRFYMTFGFEEYKRPSQFEGLKSEGIKDYICLPIPNNLVDGNSFSWTDGGGNFIADAVGDTIRDTFEAAKTSGVGWDAIKTAVSGAGDAVGGYAARGAVKIAKGGLNVVSENLGDAAMQSLGIADNPFNTVAFKGPNFKTHLFSWRLSPRNAAESETIKKIINTFKKAAHPELMSALGGGFWKYPNIVYLKFAPIKMETQLYKFKPCVIEEIEINYAPNDRPGFYAGTGAAVEVFIQIRFKEIELWRGGEGASLMDLKFPTIEGDFKDVDSPPARKVD